MLPLVVTTLALSVLGEYAHSGPTLGGPNTGSTVGEAILGSPGENITKLGTILYH